MTTRFPSDRTYDGTIPPRVYVRVQSHADWDSATGCLVSRYSIGSHGYSQVGWNSGGKRVVTLSHRVAWEATFGPIPDGLTVDHLCKNRRCVNVCHMRLLTNFENSRRTKGNDWPIGQCRHGHPNSRLRTLPSGKRVCSDCRREWNLRYVMKLRSAA